MNNILFINHKEHQCGVYQYGKRTSDILKKSDKYNFIYVEIESEEEFNEEVILYNPKQIIYNWHPSTLPWIDNDFLSKHPEIIHYALHHEGSKLFNFNYHLILDSTFSDTNTDFSIPRPLFEDINFEYKKPDIPIISSFGFGIGDKGFALLVKTVNDQFDKALIRLHIPFGYYGDREKQSIKSVYPGCYNEMYKPDIKLEITNDFLETNQLLKFLSGSTINAFFYPEMKGRGLSSVIDYALSVNRPIAITKSDMFRHIYNTSPSICIEDRSIPEIIESGVLHDQYREKWSHINLINKYDSILLSEYNTR